MYLHIKPARFDPVQDEIERRRPTYRRERALRVVGIVLMIAIWLLAWLMGMDIPYPF